MTRACLLLALGVLAGCTTSLYDRQPARSPRDAADATTYVVRPGDTLYSIATRHGVDWRALTQWNRLSDPDVLFVGQRLTLVPPRSSRGERTPAAATTPAVAAKAAANPKRPAAPPRRAPPAAAPASPPPAWQWPTRGTVASTFGASTGISTGIGIRGSAGQPIYAAAPGRVVYAGRGLMGYGELVIIRHNDTYLTAYGYNDRLLVAQGDEVTRGTQIATMGMGPGREPRLHFEIRRNGVPVDPLLYLPAPR